MAGVEPRQLFAFAGVWRRHLMSTIHNGLVLTLHGHPIRQKCLQRGYLTSKTLGQFGNPDEATVVAATFAQWNHSGVTWPYPRFHRRDCDYASGDYRRCYLASET
jgi:hypothetical protein